MSQKQYPLYADRFLESFAGASIISDQKIAIIELIANAWDAGATEVEIKWPERGDRFSIIDNGHGMTDSQFANRFRTLAYNRIKEQGSYAEVPAMHNNQIARRPTFGRNGKGRLGGFAFGESFNVSTWRDGNKNVYKVSKDVTHGLSFQKIGDAEPRDGHGTEIYIENSIGTNLSPHIIRKEIGLRFLTDPHFHVSLNGNTITFSDIPDDHVTPIEVDVEGLGKIKITAIDVQTSDKTTQQHGIAWHVKRRLVGECTWKGSGSEHLVIDGRRMAAKRLIFIVNADVLEGAVTPDWSGFIPTDEKWKKVSPVVYKKIQDYLLDLSKDQRNETFTTIEKAAQPALKKLGIVTREKWETFIKEVQEECPSISLDDLEKIAILLANLENTQSKYSLIHKLSTAKSDELNNLNEILSKWNIDFAKIVLDEIEYRSVLLEKLQAKVLTKLTLEVQELQPLFHRGLWIFGPEYETIEFTSNQGMTAVIQKLFGKAGVDGSLKRPDFAIIPDGSVGLYSLPKYDESGAEIGVDRMTIVELKKPGVAIGIDQKNQAWQYVKELLEKGLLKSYSSVTCFVLGSELDPHESDSRTEKNGSVRIIPLDYDTVMRRAKSRLLNLHEKIKNAPFLEDARIRQYMIEKSQVEMEF